MTLLVVFTATLFPNSLHPDKYKVIKGEISDQSISVLSSLEQKENQNDWGAYLELTAVDSKSSVKYFFSTTDDERTCQSATIKTNTLGEARSYERWNFYIKNFSTNKFEKIMINSEEDWNWSYQEQHLDNISNYINEKGAIVLKSSCKNCTVMDIDFLEITLNQCAATPAPENPATSTFGMDNQYNLQYNDTENIVSDGFDIIDIDSEDSSTELITSLKESGKKVVCYISAGSYENWRSDKDRFPSEVLGKNMSGWEGEKWLDISNIEQLKPIMAERMDRAKAKGCDAIHPDNIDGYSNDTGFILSYNEQLTYNKMLATLAHERSMLIGLKNDTGQVIDLVESFDFAINESCYLYNECDTYSHFIDVQKPVYIIEYQEDIFNKNSLDAKENGFHMILKNRNLDSFVKIP